MNAVPCLTWVKRGVAKQHPDRVQLVDDEVSKLVQKDQDDSGTGSDEDGSDASSSATGSDNAGNAPKRKRSKAKSKSKTKPDSSDVNGKAKLKVKQQESDDQEDDSDNDVDDQVEDDIDKRYHMSDYDDDDDNKGNPLELAGVAFYSSNKDDPYMSRVRPSGDADDSDEEELKIDPDDNLIAVGKVHGDYCNLEVWVYNEQEENLYCHHDMMLPSFPLCLEWLDFDPGDEQPGSFVALGSLVPDIEIWDLDVIDTVEPAFTLAGVQKKKTKKKKKTANISGHTDAVLDLSWNKLQRNVLASASADCTVGLWDLQEGKMVSSLVHHTEKVQSLQWHPAETHMLLSGSFDGTAKVCDCRDPDQSLKTWTMPGEVERVLWNGNNPYTFFASCDTGHVYCLDVRATDPVFTLSAHSNAVTGLSMCSSISTCLVTASDDKTVKVWDIKNNKPALVIEKNMQMGELQCSAFSPDSPLILAVGGEREMRVVNLQKNAKVVHHFGFGSKHHVDEAETFEFGREEIGARSTHKVFDSDEEKSDDGGAAAAAKKKKKKKKKKKSKPKEEAAD